MMNRVIVIMVCLFACLACNRKESAKEEIVDITPTFTDEEIEEFKVRVALYGDTEAYDWLSLQYSYPMILPWALIMANKYDYPLAYEGVFNSLAYITNFTPGRISLDGLDDETRAMAIRYLQMAIDRGRYWNLLRMAEFYYEGKYLPQDSVEGNRLMQIYRDSSAAYQARRKHSETLR